LSDVNAPTNTVKYSAAINAFVMAANGKSLYVASSNGTVDNIGFKGAVIRSLSGHTDVVNCMEMSPDKKTLITGSDDKLLILWDLVSGKEIKRFSGHGWKVTSVNFSSDGKYIVSSCNDGQTIVWDVESGKAVVTLNAMGTNARCAAFSPDMTKIAVATQMESSNQGAVIYNTPLKKAEAKAAKPAAAAKPGASKPAAGKPTTGAAKPANNKSKK
jgi:WD40 repeat protein